jgi:hypothetical protein
MSDIKTRAWHTFNFLLPTTDITEIIYFVTCGTVMSAVIDLTLGTTLVGNPLSAGMYLVKNLFLTTDTWVDFLVVATML